MVQGPRRPHRRAKLLSPAFPVTLALVLGGCGGVFQPPPAPGPEAIPELEARHRAAPGDVSTMTRLGAAYRSADRPEEARVVLERALARDANLPGATFFLGLTYEDLERYGDARALYERYLEVGTSEALKDRLRGRIALLRRQELRLAIREAVSREEELRQTAPAPRTVAVFPFEFRGSDPALEPLGRALSEMLATDLSQTDRLTVLERTRVRALMDELALSQSGAVEPSTAVRSGHLLGAGRIVQGRIEGSEEALRIDAALVRVEEGSGSDVSPVSREDAASRLLDMEKEMALVLFETMEISLTPAERERVNRRMTENLQAILAYGRGLAAEDRGDYRQAAREFAQAASIDPGFGAAQQKAEESEAMSEASGETTAEVATQAAAEALPPPDPPTVEASVERAGIRDPAQEALGTEGVGARAAGLEIILRPPPPDGDR